MIKLDKIVEQFKRFSFRALIGVSIIYMTYGIFVLLLFHVVPAENKDFVLPFAGYILGKYGTVVDWNFGSSKVDADKTKVDAINNTPTTP